MATQYQSFPDARGASKTVAKLRALQLPVLAGRSFLDVGCNEGFFCAIALAAGATRVVGIDMKPHYLERARQRFPAVDFRLQSWDEEIAGRYDVIQFSSAIHYASDQPALVRKLMGLLEPGGVLVLELGILQEAGDDYVGVKRSKGGAYPFATPTVLRRVLADFDVREMGPSVNQVGDPVPRFVLHLRHRVPLAATAARPAVLFFDAPSRSGKSSAVRALARGNTRPDIGSIAIDGVLNRMQEAEARRLPAHARVIGAVEEFRRTKSPRTDLTLQMLADAGLVDAFAAYVAASSGMQGRPLTIWDGYLPPAAREPVRLHFERLGNAVWNTAARRRFQFARLDPAALGRSLAEAADGGSASAADPLAIARLRALQLPEIAGLRVALAGIEDPALARLLAAAGPAVLLATAADAPGRHDVIACRLGEGESLPDRVAQLLGQLAENGLLAIELPLAGTRENGETIEQSAALLRRRLPVCAVRRVVLAGPQPEARPAAVLHVQHLRPIVLFVDDHLPAERAALVRLLCADATPAEPAAIAVAALEAGLVAGERLPAAPMLVCDGNVDPARRVAVHRALEARGYIVWECSRRGDYTFTPLDVNAALARAFPGSAVEPPSQAAVSGPPVSVWRRIRRAWRGLVKRFGPGGGNAAAADGSAGTARPVPVAATGPARVPGASGPGPAAVAPPAPARPAVVAGARISGRLQRCTHAADGIVLTGWALDAEAGRRPQDIVVAFDGRPVEGVAIHARTTPNLNRRLGLDSQVAVGFSIAVPYAALGGRELLLARCATDAEARAVLRVGCRVAAAGAQTHWLPAAATFGVGTGAARPPVG